MKRRTIILLAGLGLVVLFGFGYGCGCLNYRQDCVKAEAGIKAQYDQNRNNYDNMWKKFREVASVPAQYVDAMKALWERTMTARYGEGGNKALFSFIQEQNPNLSPEVYTQIQRTVEAGRNRFEADQQQLLDKKRQYEVVLNGTRSLFYNVWFGFPRVDLAKYDIVTSTKTEAVFDSKRDDDPILGPPAAER
jgi:hypothetical protein